MLAIPIEKAVPGGPRVLLGRPSSTRAEWEAARERDAHDLNRLAADGMEIEAYVAPLWSNDDAERCLQELRGFDETQVYAGVAGDDAALAAVAAASWCGAAFLGEDLSEAARFLYAGAGMEIPMLLPALSESKVEAALALAIAEDLTPREIEAVLRAERSGEPDADSLGRARDLLARP